MKYKYHWNIWVWIIVLVVTLTAFGSCCKREGHEDRLNRLIDEYIQGWRQFYPSQALAAGDKEAAFGFEDFSQTNIKDWIEFNHSILKKLDGLDLIKEQSWDIRVDARLLRRQILRELDKWEEDALHQNSPVMYVELISQAMTDILARGLLSPSETTRAMLTRLEGIGTLYDHAFKNLKNSSPYNSQSGLASLEKSAEFYGKKLPVITERWLKPEELHEFSQKALACVDKIRALATYIREEVIPGQSLPDVMGREKYNRKLEIYTDSSLSSGQLAEISLAEIQQVREIIIRKAGEYWEKQNPDREMPANQRDVLEYALAAMEAHRVDNQQDFLNYFKDLIDRAEDFIVQKGLVTLPEKRTLITELSPAHFAGAAVGGVYPSGPFNPSAYTLFYLPCVSDDAPREVKEGFYRSFNNHFNTMIITHEIVPGHYLQLKIAAANPHLVRSLFPDDLYVEGWATLCEQITLDAGWDGDDILTRLAHLRKRLENAVRAYTSVQVHCNGWDREQLTRFAVEEGLLAPQFAINLWERVMGSPLQLTSYFLGFKGFDSLLLKRKEKLGEKFILKDFNDKILNAGAVPIDELRKR